MSIKMLSCMISLLCIVTGILGDCENIRILNKKLQYTNRLEYMKYNFPINYTIRVHREEVLRASKVTRLMQRYNATESDLQKLWWFTSNNIVKRIRDVLPKKHPSYNYTTDLQNIMEETLNTTEASQTRFDASGANGHCHRNQINGTIIMNLTC
ncbi:interleukin-34 isoform X2 [Microcaecilia unicolor]|uniref:Interleukin-34 isoform X2 n=1 Tax=Microcaecilia unicolor TaxID=1415580 RepID=A0A6P7Y3N4_9AMPH|nr:interleukin-34 isoform X2 [Microcaecilia unicolor]